MATTIGTAEVRADNITPAFTITVNVKVGPVWYIRVWWWTFFMRLAKLSYPGKMRIKFENDTDFAQEQP